MNSPFVADRARALADRLRSESSDQEIQIRRACRICFGREPEDEECSDLLAFLVQPPSPGEVRAETKNAPTSQEAVQAVVPLDQLAALCQALLVTSEFRIVD
jgi:TorA maturation chaperone TorD